MWVQPICRNTCSHMSYRVRYKEWVIYNIFLRTFPEECVIHFHQFCLRMLILYVKPSFFSNSSLQPRNNISRRESYYSDSRTISHAFLFNACAFEQVCQTRFILQNVIGAAFRKHFWKSPIRRFQHLFNTNCKFG